jgi:hypothetical protein
MAYFLDRQALNREIKALFNEAETSLLIISPYIKLHDTLKRILEPKKKNPEFLIRILFGKNENNIGKSLQSGDLEFFKGFTNVEIYYNADLHAKYYANETKSIITSMNLHDYSMKNNIEAGVLFEHRSFWGVDNENDNTSYNYFEDLLESSEEILIKHPKEEKRFFGLLRSYGESVTEVDRSDKIQRTTKSSRVDQVEGYCIRTGIPIPFNIQRPFSEKAFASWSLFSNGNYPEKYCHFSGEKSNGETTMLRPVMRKNYTAAKALEKK